MQRLGSKVLISSFVMAASSLAWADVVPPAPDDCPEGHTPQTDHGGPHCQPPKPTLCPKEHIPRVRRDLAYCEPPPVEPCPKGSRWTSKSATDTYCVGGRSCTEDAECGRGKCLQGKLCVEKVANFRAGSYEKVYGECTGPDDCEGENRECVEAKRCDLIRRRIASSPEVAKPFDLAAAQASASPKAPSAPGSASAAPGVEPSSAEAEGTNKTQPSSGCGSCAQRPGAPARSGLWLLAMAVALGWRRRR